uniref:Uncharacterized protein n=1 Tax=Picea sitchensis TaxID=3332 RepID=A9NQY1_PICSI|nr:unknown [Picea sitchensis]
MASCRQLYCLLLSLFSVAVLFCSTKSSEQLSAYTVLEQFGFPRGILPANAGAYTLNSDDGSFVINLESPCSLDLDSGYQLKYRSQITGRIETGAIRKLTGVSVKVLFFWVSIDEAIRDGDELLFYVGVVRLRSPFPTSIYVLSVAVGSSVRFPCSGPTSRAIPIVFYR